MLQDERSRMQAVSGNALSLALTLRPSPRPPSLWEGGIGGWSGGGAAARDGKGSAYTIRIPPSVSRTRGRGGETGANYNSPPARTCSAEERLLTLALAVLIDRVLGEPPAALHPVVGIGKLIGALERRASMSSNTLAFAYGSAMTVATTGAAMLVSALIERIIGGLPLVPRLLLRAVILKPTFAVRELFAAGERVCQPLEEKGDLAAAREALCSLVSRDTSALDAPLIAAAAVESLAENTSDSIVAPWLAYLVAGLPGAYFYRAANTLDAMIGYRGQYEYLGKCAARLDDLLNVVPSRLTAALIVLGSAVSGADARRAFAMAIRDHHKTASPNAGWPMSAMAGALGVQLEKVGHYQLGEPDRPVKAADIAAAGKIVRRGIGLGLLAMVVVSVIRVAWRRKGGAP